MTFAGLKGKKSEARAHSGRQAATHPAHEILQHPAFHHLFHGLLHLVELLEQPIDLRERHARPLLQCAACASRR